MIVNSGLYVTAQTGVYDHPYTRVHYPCTPPLRYRTDRSLRSTVHEFHYPCTPPFRYRTDRSLRSSVHTSFIIPAPIRSVTVHTGVYDHPYTRGSLSLHPSVPLPYRTGVYDHPYTRVSLSLHSGRSVTAQTGVYGSMYTRVSLSLHSGPYGNGTDGCRDNETRVYG